MKPIIKWAGGKSKVLPHLIERMPLNYRRYIEPFFGGGALFFHLRPIEAVINDMNPALMSMYGCVRDNVDRVIGQLRAFRQGPEEYYAVRQQWNAGEGTLSWRAAAFLYMNRTCFNGLWRVNAAGGFNVPYRKKKANFLDEGALRAASIVLRTAFVACGSFERVCTIARHGDLVYFDPPYDGTFTKYTSDGFNQDAQSHLCGVADYLRDRGASVMLSNTATPFIRELYKDWNLHEISVRHNVGATSDRRGQVSELIITNF